MISSSSSGADASSPKESLRKDSGMCFEYNNPNTQLEFRDTQIIPDNGRFYAIGTCAPYWNNNPVPNPGVKLYSSVDLASWKYEGILIDAAKLPDDSWYKDRFWAPEIARIKSKYYLTFNCQNESAAHKHFHGCGIAVAEKITGPYKIGRAHV